MDFPLHTDALLYVVVAKSILAVLLIIAGIAAIFVGARLFQRGLYLTPEAPEHPETAEYGYKRLSKDTFLPRGTAIRNKTDGERFTKLEQDRWVSAGTLIRVELTDTETKRHLQLSGALLMASSLLWGWLAYLSSPLDIPRINKALEVSQEHKIHNLLTSIQANTQTAAKAEQLTAVLQHTQNASAKLSDAVQQLHSGLDAVNMQLADSSKIDALQLALQHSEAQLQQLGANLSNVQTQVLAVKTLAADTQPLDALHHELQQAQLRWQSGVGLLRDALGQAQTQIQNQFQISALQLKTDLQQSQQQAFADNQQTLQQLNDNMQELQKLTINAGTDFQADLIQQKHQLAARLTQLEQTQTAQNTKNQAQMTVLIEHLQNIQQHLQTVQQQTQTAQASHQTTLQTALEPLQKQVLALQDKLAQTPQQIAAPLQTMQTTLQNLQEHLATLPKDTASAAAVAQLQKDMQQFVAGLATASTANAKSTDNVVVGLAQIQHQLNELSQQLQNLVQSTSASSATSSADVKQHAAELATVQNDLAAIKQQMQRLPENFSNLNNSLKAVSEALAKLQAPAISAPPQPAIPAASTAERTAERIATAELAPPSHPLVKKLLDPNTPTLANWGAYVDIPVSFISGSSSQLSDDKPLKNLVEALQSPHLQDKQILLQGYTDSQGSAAANLRLSAKRASFVREWLLKNTALPADKLQTEGKGEADPIADNATAAGRSSNRRIRLSIK